MRHNLPLLRNLIWGLFCLLLFGNSKALYSQPVMGMPSPAGKCYAKCLISEPIENVFCYVYNGDKSESVVSVVNIVPSAKREWVEKKADRDCLSANPDDCIPWSFVEVPGSREEYSVPTYTKEFITALVNQDTLLKYRKNVESGSNSEQGFTEWREVICGDSPEDNDIIKQVKEALQSRGFNVGTSGSNSIWGAEAKASLVKYQKQNYLPIGSIDLITLDALGIEGYVGKHLYDFYPKGCYGQFFPLNDSVLASYVVHHIPIYIGNKPQKVNFENETERIVKDDFKLDKLLKRNPDAIEWRQLKNAVEYVAENGIVQVPILCDYRADYDFVLNLVIQKLSVLGYDVDDTFTPKTRAALAKYQVEHGLLVGYLDYDTLDFLRVRY